MTIHLFLLSIVLHFQYKRNWGYKLRYLTYPLPPATIDLHLVDFRILDPIESLQPQSAYFNLFINIQSTRPLGMSDTSSHHSNHQYPSLTIKQVFHGQNVMDLNCGLIFHGLNAMFMNCSIIFHSLNELFLIVKALKNFCESIGWTLVAGE